MPRAAAALLYSGVTAARSIGDGLDASLKLRRSIAERQRNSARSFSSADRCSPPRAATAPSSSSNVPAAITGHREGAVGAHSQDARGGPPAGARAEGQRASMASRRFWKRAGARGCSTTAWICCWCARWPRRRTRRTSRWPSHTGDARDVADAVEIGGASPWSTGRGATKFPTPAGAHGHAGRLSRPHTRCRGGLRALLRRQAGRAGSIRWCSRWCRRACSRVRASS